MAGVDCSTCNDCNSCFTCHVYGGDCYATHCAPNPQCVSLGSCLVGCGMDQTCGSNCFATYPNGAGDLQATVQCGCGACAMCAGQGGC